MAETEALELSPPTTDDVKTARAAWREGRVVHEVARGESWWRVVRAGSPRQALDYAEVRFPSDSNNRFTPLYLGGAIAPAAYAGDTDVTALWEVVSRSFATMECAGCRSAKSGIGISCKCEHPDR